MADFTKTFVNSITFFGGAKANRWGSMVWGVDNWGTTADLPLGITHFYGNSLDMSSTVTGKTVIHFYDNSLDMSSTVGKQTSRYYTNSMTVSNSMTSVHLKNGDYYYRFPGGINLVNKVSTSFTLQSFTSSAWSEATFTTTTWS